MRWHQEQCHIHHYHAYGHVTVVNVVFVFMSPCNLLVIGILAALWHCDIKMSAWNHHYFLYRTGVITVNAIRPFEDGLWCHGLPQVPFISFIPHAAKQSSPPSWTGSPFMRHVPKLHIHLKGGVLACQRLSFMLRFAVFWRAKGRVLQSRCFCAGFQGALLVWYCGRASPRAGRP